MHVRWLLALALALAMAVPLSDRPRDAPPAGETKSEIVAFNTKSLRFHCRTCAAAKRCTRNCIDLPRAEAKSRGGVPCKICGGSCSIAE